MQGNPELTPSTQLELQYGSEPPHPPKWRKRATAGIALLVLLVVAGVAGHQLDPNSSNQLATQPIPNPAASSSSNNSKSNSLNIAAVTARVDPGVVDITATDGYQNAVSAGTGMILTSNGEVLTNNHVINGATSITVQVDGAGPKYTAQVVGYDATADIALLQLENVSNLHVITVGNSNNATIGMSVVAIGNALNLPGKPTVTNGAITALNRSITASDQVGTNSEHLTGMFQIDATLEPGNSGGPLTNASGQVIGMNTAVDTSGSNSSTAASSVGFAIPINKALAIASEIQQSKSSSIIHIGLPAFIGVDIENANGASNGGGSGALIIGVIPNTPATTAGLVAGDVITAVNGIAITSASGLSIALAPDQPGQSISLTWIDAANSSHTTTLTLATGPAS